MILLTLIQTSIDRRKELIRFVKSLNKQVGINLNELQLIFVDQGNNKEVFNSLSSKILLNYIQTNRCSLSYARNLAIPLVKGKFICFPDDDCWYEPDTLKTAFDYLNGNMWQGVCGKGLNEKGVLTHVFPTMAHEITRENRCGAISYTMFYKFVPTLFFDENLGVGSPFNLGAGEETDYLIFLIDTYKYKVLYTPDLIIHHPANSDYTDNKYLLKKAYLYSRGAGYLLKKHKFSLAYKLKSFIRPIGGIVLYTLIFKIDKVKKYFYVLKGLIEGYNFNLPHHS